MILTDREIKISLSERLFEVTPEPDSSAYSSSSLDLKLDENIRLYKPNIGGIDLIIDPAVPSFKFNKAHLSRSFRME